EDQRRTDRRRADHPREAWRVDTAMLRPETVTSPGLGLPSVGVRAGSQLLMVSLRTPWRVMPSGPSPDLGRPAGRRKAQRPDSVSRLGACVGCEQVAEAGGEGVAHPGGVVVLVQEVGVDAQGGGG